MFVRTSSANSVRRLVNLIQNTTHINFLQPALQTTAMNSLYIYPDGQVAAGILDGYFIQLDGNKCCCSTDSCLSQSSFFDLYTYANVSEFMTGCYSIESLLESTLECLFDQVCVNTLLRFFPRNNITDIDVLRINQTKFLPKT
jgi:hypothetical protein